MHVLAEEISDDGLNSPLGLGIGCLRVGFNLQYFNNVIHTNSRVFLTELINRENFGQQITCNLPNLLKFSPSKILYCTVVETCSSRLSITTGLLE